MTRRRAAIVFSALIALATPAAAQQAPQGEAAKPAASSQQPTQSQGGESATLTGDWGGTRTWLHDHGVDINSGFKSEIAGLVAGPDPKRGAQSGEFDLGLVIDSGKLWGLAGGTFEATVTQREGRLPPGNLLQQSEEVYGRGNIARLTELWWRQKLLNNQLTIKFGRLPQGDFNGFSCEFMNLTFCGAPAGNLVGNYWYNWPITQWAAWARYDFAEFYVMSGVYEQNPNVLDQQFSPGWTCCVTGAMSHGELGYSPKFGGLQGHYQVGGWYDSASAPDVLVGANGQPFALTGEAPLQQPGQYGFYVQGLQQITGAATYNPDDGWKDQSGLSLFFNFTATDRATSTLDNQVAFGLFYAGPFASRPQDSILAAVGRTEYNPRAAEALSLASPGAPTPSAEYPIEVTYNYQATKWLDVRPDFQYVIHPGGYANRGADMILGVRTDVKF